MDRPTTHPPTRLEAKQEATPAGDVLVDAAVQCELDLGDADLKLSARQSLAVETPSVTFSAGSCLQGAPLMFEIGEGSVNVADSH